MSKHLRTLLAAAAIACLAGFVTPAAAQITTIDTENQSGTSLVLRGNAFIQQLIATYGAGSRVVDVARDLLSKLGPQYQRAVIQAQRDAAATAIASATAQRDTLVDDIADIDAAILALDPMAPNYATLLASLQSTRAAKVSAVANIDTTVLAPLVVQRDSLDAQLAALPAPFDAYFQQNLNGWVAELGKISVAGNAATLGSFAAVNAIAINDLQVVAVAAGWGNGFGGSQSAGGYRYTHALNSGQLVDDGMTRTANRDYSYTMSGGLITVNVQVTTHYYGFLAIGAADAAAAPADIPALGPLAIVLLALVVGCIGSRSVRRR